MTYDVKIFIHWED